MTQPRSYGKADAQVLTRLYEQLRDVAWHARPEHQQPIVEQLDRLRSTNHTQDFDDSKLAPQPSERFIRHSAELDGLIRVIGRLLDALSLATA